MNKEIEDNKVQKKETSLKANVILNFIYQFLIIVIPLITTPYLSRVLKEENVGINSYTLSLVELFTIFAALGTYAYGTREIARKKNDKATYSQLFFEIELLSVITSTISLLFWVIFSTLYVEYRFYLYILSMNIVATLFDISWLYAGVEKFKYTIGVNALFKITGAALIFIFIHKPEHLWIYMLIHSSTILLSNISMWIFLPKIISKPKFSSLNFKFHLKNSLKYFIPTVAVTIYTVLDKTLIGALILGYVDEEKTIKLANVESGYYEQATKIMTIAKSLCFISINNVMYSRASHLYEEQNIEKIKSLLNKTLNITLNLSFGAMFGLILVSSVLVPTYFGEGYDKSIYLIYILSGVIPIIAISNALGAIYYVPFGKRGQSAKYLIIGSVVNLVLNIPLIIFFKSIGAAIATIIAELVITILYVVKSDNFLNVKNLFATLWKKILSGLIMFGLLYLSKFFFENNIGPSKLINIIELVVLIISGFVIYELILSLLKDNSILEFKEFLKSILGKKKNEHK